VARAAHEQAILDAHRSGESLRDIASRAGVTHTRIYAIVKAARPKKNSSELTTIITLAFALPTLGEVALDLAHVVLF
jgi:hypothetical protein